jgi:two-component system response regulator
VILLVDDDGDLRILVRDAIISARPDAEIREAASAPEAIEYLERCSPGGPVPRPDLIYLDIEMFGHSGLSVLHMVKNRPLLREIPVVMLTGVDDNEQISRAAQIGANSYIVKPSNPVQMLKAVRMATEYWLNLHQLCQAG